MTNPGDDHVAEKCLGKYRGRVIDNDDPSDLGRLRIEVPQIPRSLSQWAVACVPYAGGQRSARDVPPPGTSVWVEFEGGDPSSPIWVGCFWNEGETATPRPPDETNKMKAIVTPSDLEVTIDDGREIIEVETPAKQNVTIDATDITLSAQDNVDIEGAQIANKAQAKFSATGAAAAELIASGICTVRGAMVKINESGETSCHQQPESWICIDARCSPRVCHQYRMSEVRSRAPARRRSSSPTCRPRKSVTLRSVSDRPTSSSRAHLP